MSGDVLLCDQVAREQIALQRIYYDQRLTDMAKLIDQRFICLEKDADELSKTAREELVSAAKREGRLHMIETAIANSGGKSFGINQTATWVLSIITIVVAVWIGFWGGASK